MNFITWQRCDDPTKLDMSCLQANIGFCTYSTLVELFGEPKFIDSPEDKVDCEWHICVTDSENHETHYVSIYNWKDGYNYCGGEGKPCHQITQWNIGGHTYGGASIIEQIVVGKVMAEVSQ